MVEKLNAREFGTVFLPQRVAAHDGYIMGAIGQDPKKLSGWYFAQYSGEQKKKALYWKEHAARVWDCQGLAEGYINDKRGTKINVRARDNYASWCDPKGSGKIPDQYKIPGAAVFIHNGSYISHVGYLTEPVDKYKPSGDWWVVEARGVMYGVVKTKLSARGWNRWGLMTKYFSYDGVPDAQEPELGSRILKKGMSGEDVKAMQSALIALGYSCGKYGADGDFGSGTEKAVRAFQKDQGLSVDGQFGPKSLEALDKAMPDDGEAEGKPEAAAGKVVIQGGDCHMRLGPGKEYDSAGVAKEGSTLESPDTTGWVPVAKDGRVLWASAKYAKVGG